MNAKKIENAIERKKITKAELAEKCSITRRTLDNILKGADAKVSTIEVIAQVLGVSIVEFFDEDVCLVEHNEAHTHGDRSQAQAKGTQTMVANVEDAQTVADLRKIIALYERIHPDLKEL